MAQEANVIIYGLLVQQESVFSGSVVFDLGADGDGINVTELPEFAINYQHAGERPSPQGTEGKIKRQAPTGRTVEGTIKSEMAGSELPYSATTASNLPPLNALIEASGFSGSIEGTSVIYKRNPVDEAFSLAARLFSRDTVRDVAGGYCSFNWGFEEPGAPVIAEFTLMGIVSRPSASLTFPTIVYPDQDPPRAIDVALTLNGSSSLVVRSANMVDGRDLATPRIDANSAQGSIGFAVGRFDYQLTVVVEATTAVFDAYQLRDDATEIAASITFGDVAGNILAWSWPQCVITEVNEQDDGPVAMLELVIDIHNSNPALRDDLTITFS